MRVLAIALVLFAACSSSNRKTAGDAAVVEPVPVPVSDAAAPAQTPTVSKPSAGARTEDETNSIGVFRAVAPATVFVSQIQVVADRFTRRAMEVPAGTGTGFVWDKEGHIVTNLHVVAGRGRPKLRVTLWGRKSYPATLVGFDKNKDIAVLKIDAPKDQLTPVRQTEQGYKLEVGQKTVAIGNPFGLDHTLTTGVVSALGREVKGFGGLTIRDMIQTDAAINPGNSGGPLLDSQGRLIGMNTMIYSKSGSSAGIGFAVPFMFIQRVVPQIIRTGKPERIGIGVTLLDDSVARRNGIAGVIIESVQAPSAKQAGFRGLQETRYGIDIGDVIVRIDKHEVKNYDDLHNALDRFKATDVIDITVRRDGRNLVLKTQLIVVN